MSLTQEQITRLKKLTALSGENRVEISSVLESFSAIQAIDTTSITDITRSGAGVLVPRSDSVISTDLSDELLACSKQKKAAHQIVLGSIMIGE